MPPKDGFGGLPGGRLIYVSGLPFMAAVGTTVYGSPGTDKTCQEGKASLACGYICRTASWTFHGVDCLCTGVFLLLYLGFKLAEFELIFDWIFFF